MKLILALFIFLLAGCSNPLGSDRSKIDSDYGPNPSADSAPAQPVSTGYEAVSGSVLGAQTSSGHRFVDVTVGSSTTPIKLTTTKNKIIYLSVQGQLASGQ
jgi:hypothetical protein